MDHETPQDHEHDHGHPHRHAEACRESAEPLPVARSRYRHVFRVRGLDCAEEVSALRQAVGPLVGGGEHLAFDVLNGRMMVLEDAPAVSAEEIRRAVRGTGMAAAEWRPDDAADQGVELRHQRVQLWLTVLSGGSTAAGFGLHLWLAGPDLAGGYAEALGLLGGHAGQPTPWPEIAAYVLAIAFGARFVVVKAWYAARSLRPDIHFLMTIAVAGAIVIGEWFEAATVTFLFALSLLLESRSVGRARRAISSLLDLAPPVVRLKCASGAEIEVLAADVTPGSRFVVRPGERIPLDGVVVAGTSAVDQAPITGESMPDAKDPGAVVFAGTINGDGVLEVESTRVAQDTTLARIIRLVEEAQGRRARAEQWVEKFARVYTPAVILLAIAVFLMPPLIVGASWEAWFYRALVLLVIACPCALVISTPVSVVSALAAAARQGVLVKGGSYIELPARLRAIAFDKTGTLSEGEARVAAIVPLDGHTEAELLERAAALESRSAHPLARAILRAAVERGVTVTPADDSQLLQGKGVTGRFRETPFWLGSHRHLLERGQDSPQISAQAAALERDGQTVVLIGNDDHVCGLIAVADAVRPEARGVVSALRGAGVAHLVLLTGDNRVTAEAIAHKTGIDEVQAELLPEDKVMAIEQLVERYGAVAMVGDGVNDAPAMARASLGIAMGAIGSDAAIETADIALMTDDLSRLPWLVGHSRRTLAVIRQNIGFALGVKAAFVILTFSGAATLWGAIAADVGASLLVVANALRLLRSGSADSGADTQPRPSSGSG